MDYTALNEVTETIIAIVQKAIDDTANWPGLKVLPELLKNDNEGIGFYLFHVQENAQYKNYPSPGKDSPAVNFTPMALNLFYQLSANKRKDNNEDAYEEQKLMSVALKALHDHSVITRTISATNPVGKKVNFKITLQTLTPSESVQYWAAAESAAKLSAYYEVSVVFLEPETSKSYAGRVLTYGNYIFVHGTPQITASQNFIEYTVPGDLTLRQVSIQPAQSPPAIVSPAPVNSVVHFFGNSFGGGTLDMALVNARWPVAARLTAAWLLNLVADNEVTITVQETADLQGAPVTVLPGLYAAQLGITEQRTLPDLSIKQFHHISNQFPFSVMPRIDSIVKGAGGLFTVTGFVFQDAGLVPESIQVYIGETRLALHDSGPFNAEQFRVTGLHTLELIVPAGLLPGIVPLRILINGIESEPKWITVP